jgi:UDP:flavonoid glycosyltransferase YjiC (YdhE family)
MSWPTHPWVDILLTVAGAWNSTLESIIAGVPMICWPQFGDHQINSRWVNEVWRIGLDMKDTFDRLTVETMIKTLMMEDKGAEIMESMDRIAKLAHDCVSLAKVDLLTTIWTTLLKTYDN